MKKQKWRRLDAEGVKLFKEMLIMFSYRVDNPKYIGSVSSSSFLSDLGKWQG